MQHFCMQITFLVVESDKKIAKSYTRKLLLQQPALWPMYSIICENNALLWLDLVIQQIGQNQANNFKGKITLKKEKGFFCQNLNILEQ